MEIQKQKQHSQLKTTLGQPQSFAA